MGRHGVLRNVEEARHLSSRDPIRLMHHNQLERIHAGWLGKSRKSFDCLFFFHISGFIDALENVKSGLSVLG